MSRIRQSASRQAPPETGHDAPEVGSGDESRPVSAVGAEIPAGELLPRHRHRRAQLVYAVEGVMTVETDAGLWVVPPLRALWVPAGVVHSIRMTGRVLMRTLYFEPAAVAHVAVPARPAVLAVSPLLRELIVRVVETIGVGRVDERRSAAERAGAHRRKTGRVDVPRADAGSGAATRADLGSGAAPSASGARNLDTTVALLLDELVEAPVSPLEIPVPSDQRLRRITDALRADPSDPRDVAAWARLAGMSERTLARAFPEGTGMTLVRWRQQVRLLRALERLGIGESVTAVTMDLGYGSVSAFVKLFRESFGVTPGRYFDP
jgi:AraC-like DNA-binding protein/quercetin dioxygenase-like cupin family protein